MNEARRARNRVQQSKLAVVLAVLLIPTVMAVVVFSRGSGLVGQWYDRNNRPLPNGDESGEALVLDVDIGHPHCDEEHIVFLDLAWPVGSVLREGRNRPNLRQYIRNPGPDSVSQQGVPETYVPDAPLPADAFDPGFHRGDWHLWISPSQADRYIFLVSEDRTERWTRSPERLGCA